MGVVTLVLCAGFTSCQTSGTGSIAPMWLDAPAAEVGSGTPPAVVTEPAPPAAREYQTVWAKRFPETVPAEQVPVIEPLVKPVVDPVVRPVTRFLGMRRESRMFEQFYDAAASPSRDVAQRRWKRFTDEYVLPGEEYEDPTAARLCEWARGEMHRCDLLATGQTGEAEACEARLLASLRNR